MNLACLSLSLLVLCGWISVDRRVYSLLVSPSDGDNIVSPGVHHYCDGPINIPYHIFSHNTLYVRSVGYLTLTEIGQI